MEPMDWMFLFIVIIGFMAMIYVAMWPCPNIPECKVIDCPAYDCPTCMCPSCPCEVEHANNTDVILLRYKGNEIYFTLPADES